MKSLQRAEEILLFWFGPGQSADLPSPERTHVWFGMDPRVDTGIKEKFENDAFWAINGELDHWADNPRSTLALIIILDQFSRHVFRNTPQAYAQDPKALSLCLEGLKQEKDQHLSLIERVFFYLPLQHSEDIHMQTHSIRAYENLLELALVETRALFKTFYDYAVRHYEVIEKFNRFPHRNIVLGRESTLEELEFLQKNKNFF